MELLTHYSDSTMADAFIERHQHDVRFVPGVGWMIRDLSTMGWEKTDEDAIVGLSDQLARDALESVHEAMAVEHFRAAEARLNYYPIKNVVRLVKKRPPILVDGDAMMSRHAEAAQEEQGS